LVQLMANEDASHSELFGALEGSVLYMYIYIYMRERGRGEQVGQMTKRKTERLHMIFFFFLSFFS
jgi:hypothetical protein